MTYCTVLISKQRRQHEVYITSKLTSNTCNIVSKTDDKVVMHFRTQFDLQRSTTEFCTVESSKHAEHECINQCIADAAVMCTIMKCI